MELTPQWQKLCQKKVTGHLHVTLICVQSLSSVLPWHSAVGPPSQTSTFYWLNSFIKNILIFPLVTYLSPNALCKFFNEQGQSIINTHTSILIIWHKSQLQMDQHKTWQKRIWGITLSSLEQENILNRTVSTCTKINNNCDLTKWEASAQ